MHQKFKTAAVVLVVAVTTWNRAVEAGNVASGDNRHTFDALCAIIRAAEATVEVATTSVDPEKLYQYIQKLNMSVATKTWQDMFVSKPNPLELHTDPTKASIKGRGFEGSWQDWMAAITAVKDKQPHEELKNSGFLKLSDNDKAEVRAVMADITRQAEGLISHFRAQTKPESEPTTATVEQALREAAYGDKSATASSVTLAQMFGTAPAGTKRKQMENINEEGNSTTTKKYKRKARADFTKATSAKLDKLYSTAVRVNEDLANTKRLIASEETKIKKELREALLGGTRSGSAEKPQADGDVFSGTYAASCYGAAGPGKSLANDLVCICGTGSSSDSTTLVQCTSITDSSGYSDDHSSASNAIKIYNKLAAICQKSAATEEASPENIAAAITAFTALLGR
uniref:Variant surface glycoprotein 1125.1349 n=1 Tax=Trypanosoma brucei TaxID=5691 RepID=A0A1J0R6Z5_9TRYP|nr:variant surface glycoprotein 1125.1349 [Trypanosoma brucei]